LGISLGLVGAFLLSRLMETLLFDVPHTDLLTYAVVTTLLLVVALGASWVPAWRAARVNPITVLRAE
jgi:ABC-type lipoprotein release transport system permease subunit